MLQGESRFRSELEKYDIKVTSRIFRTEDDPILTEDLFVSCTSYSVVCLWLFIYGNCFLFRLKVKIIVLL